MSKPSTEREREANTMTSNRPSITGKVARVLSDRELVINRGRNQGVEIGMQFAVLNDENVPILDPDTHQIIGSVPVAKTVVKIVRLDDNVATGRTFRQIPGRVGAFALMSQIAPSTPELLEAEGKTLSQELSEAGTYVIRVGDPVTETNGEEFTLPEL